MLLSFTGPSWRLSVLWARLSPSRKNSLLLEIPGVVVEADDGGEAAEVVLVERLVVYEEGMPSRLADAFSGEADDALEMASLSVTDDDYVAPCKAEWLAAESADEEAVARREGRGHAVAPDDVWGEARHSELDPPELLVKSPIRPSTGSGRTFRKGRAFEWSG